MTPRENLLSVLRRQGLTEVPLDIELVASQYERFQRETGMTDVAEYFRFSHRGVHVAMEGPDDARSLYAREELPERTRFDAWGVAHSAGSEAAYHMTRLHHPLRGATSLNEIVDFPQPRIHAEAELNRLRTETERIHDAGLAVMGGMAQTIWETAWAIRSMEDLMVDMMSEDEMATVLLDRVTDISCARAGLFAAAGCDIVHLGDDIGMQSTPMMSVDLWRTWLKPRLARVIDAAREKSADILIFYHSCGFVEPFIDDLIELGVEILNPVQPESMNFASIHERYGDRLSFWGTIGTQRTMPFGSVEDVKNEVRRNVGICGEAGGIVIGPTHVVEPEVPWENIVALREVCDELSTALVTTTDRHR
ncbi:MAG TPA: uroporphyrinogen decarboxylase family protein [Spirochaetia bacterium]|nr:uroporphyrinogen decarboxylase family protein [Spirochaetia bacterium]